LRPPSNGHAMVDGVEPRFNANVQPCPQRTLQVRRRRGGRRGLGRGVTWAAGGSDAGEVGRAAHGDSPTCEKDFTYVGIDATTIRARTLTSSIPATEACNRASITNPLSRTRSYTSITLK